MKLLLPNRKNGFTLIELLVVVAIIAILGLIGFSVFSSAQSAARDGRRRTEINALGKVLEAGRDFEAGLYKYATADYTIDFTGNNKAEDPLNDTQKYCVLVNTKNKVPPAVPVTDALDATLCVTMTCPTGTATDCTLVTISKAGLSASITAGMAWTLCANLEKSTTPFCVQSLFR